MEATTINSRLTRAEGIKEILAESGLEGIDFVGEKSKFTEPTRMTQCCFSRKRQKQVIHTTVLCYATTQDTFNPEELNRKGEEMMGLFRSRDSIKWSEYERRFKALAPFVVEYHRVIGKIRHFYGALISLDSDLPKINYLSQHDQELSDHCRKVEEQYRGVLSDKLRTSTDIVLFPNAQTARDYLEDPRSSVYHKMVPYESLKPFKKLVIPHCDWMFND